MTITTELSRLNAYGDYLGHAELANVLGLSKQALHNRRTRGKIPRPLVVLALGPVWTKEQITYWLLAAPHSLHRSTAPGA